MQRLTMPLLPFAFLGGCVLGESDAPQLLVPEDIEVQWDAPFDGTDDGRVALVPVDVMIYDGASGEALSDVEVEVSTTWHDAGFVVPDDVSAVGVTDTSSDDVVWDAWRDRYFAVDRVDSALRIRTDASGLARVYVFADSFPTSGTGAGSQPIPVVVSMGITDDTFLLVPR
jgi:hypothetical protein